MTDKALRTAGLFVAPVIMLIGLWLCLEGLEHGKLRELLRASDDAVVSAGAWIASELGATGRELLSDVMPLLHHARKPSVSLEDAFWNSLKAIAAERGMTLQELVAAIDRNRDQPRHWA